MRRSEPAADESGGLTIRPRGPKLVVMWSKRNLRQRVLGLTGAMLLMAGSGGEARADDLVTLSGATYHDVRPVRVEPDGITWQYDEGMCKVDFTDSPKSVCTAYGYDAAKATAYRNAQAQARRQAEEQTRQILQDSEIRRVARLQTEAANRRSQTTTGSELVFRRAASPAASESTRALGEQMAAAAVKKAVAPTGAWAALANSRVGSILAASGLISFAPLGPPPNKDEFQADLHHPKGTGPAVDAARDAFYTPDYATKSYFEDADRAAAFARGVPLRP